MKRFTILLAAVLVALMIAAPAMAHEEGSWILRAGVGTVAPESNNLVLPDFPAVDLTTTVNVDNGTSLTLTGTYMFTENWAFDILAAWPFSHDIDAAAFHTRRETRKRGIDRGNVPDADGLVGNGSGNRKRHGDTMVAEALYFAAAEPAATDNCTVRRFFDCNTECLEPRGHCGDAITFLDPEFRKA